MIKQTRNIVMAFAALMVAACSGEEKYEHPEYAVLKQEGDIEIREYAPMLLAEVTVNEPDRGDAGNAAFRMLFDYISGDNIAEQDIAMTVPVTQVQEGQKIAMTVPVTQTQETKGWRTSFRLPSALTLKTAPAPQDERIRLYNSKKEKLAVIRFSGFWGDENVAEHRALLEAYIAKHGLKVTGSMRAAFYNSPFTLPWERRNEVLYPIQ